MERTLAPLYQIHSSHSSYYRFTIVTRCRCMYYSNPATTVREPTKFDGWLSSQRMVTFLYFAIHPQDVLADLQVWSEEIIRNG